MADTIIAFDHLDSKLGDFFKSCKDEIEIYLISIGINPFFLDSGRLNELAVNILTAQHKSFVFGAYSHGNSECLLKSARTSYISTTINNLSFKDSFFYTFSCSSGAVLGKHLTDNGCHCFIGYKKKVYIWDTYPRPFVECANYGLKLFYNGEETYSIIKEMKNKYTEEIDKLYKIDFAIASCLRDNRDCLTIHGKNIKISDI